MALDVLLSAALEYIMFIVLEMVKTSQRPGDMEELYGIEGENQSL